MSHRIQGVEKLVRRATFQEVARSACSHHRGNEGHIGERGKSEHFHAGMLELYRTCRCDAVHHGHVHVHQDDVRGEFLNLAKGVGAVGSFAHDGETVSQFDELAEGVPDRGMVVYDQYLQQLSYVGAAAVLSSGCDEAHKRCIGILAGKAKGAGMESHSWLFL
jgi:hypothetical protein